jgi:hypothetical protein
LSYVSASIAHLTTALLTLGPWGGDMNILEFWLWERWGT